MILPPTITRCFVPQRSLELPEGMVHWSPGRSQWPLWLGPGARPFRVCALCGPRRGSQCKPRREPRLLARFVAPPPCPRAANGACWLVVSSIFAVRSDAFSGKHTTNAISKQMFLWQYWRRPLASCTSASSFGH